MNAKSVLWIVVGGVAVVVALVVLFSSPGGGVRNVDGAGVRAAIEQGAQIIDVRTDGEFQMGHIPGAINVPVDQIGAAAQSWDRNATYVVYCATGSRSATAVETMKAMGFGNIRHLNAGIVAWDGELEKGASAGRKIETNGKPVFVDFWTPS